MADFNMDDKLKQLVDELLKSGKDFSIENEQSCVRIWIDDTDYSLNLGANGKWWLE